jgi:hypothetical protein
MRRILAACGAAVALVATVNAGPALAGAPADVEAGIFIDYLAPDPGGPTPGTITFGYLGSAEVIAADAELVPPADTNLPFLVGGAPTCLEVSRQAGEITRLAFIASCTVSGPVTLVPDVFGPGANAYMTSDRVVTPEAVVLADPAINALMKTTADSGGILSVTFQVDVSFGAPTAFAAMTSIGGPVDIVDSGDVHVGPAVLLAPVIDPASRALLEQADAEDLDASVTIEGEGIIDVSGKSQPAVTIALTVTLAAPPDPTPAPSSPALLPDTSLVDATGAPPSAELVLLVLIAAASAAGAARHARRMAAVRPSDAPWTRGSG